MTLAQKKEALKVYSEKGLNSLYSFLKKNGINYSKTVREFGLNTNSQARAQKDEFVKPEDFKLHYYSLAVRGKNRYTYNRIRGIEINF